MRAVLWLLALFGIASAIALFAGNNQGTVTVFWPPYRIDVSLNLALLIAVALFAFIHAVLGALAALFDLPRQAQRWRNQQKERSTYAFLLDGFAHLTAGRFIRARKSAESAIAQEQSLKDAGVKLAGAAQLRTIAHLLAAESAQALQDRAAREEHLRLALEDASTREAQETHEGALMRAARWSLQDREPEAALKWLKDMPQGAARRTLALRTRLKASRLAGLSAEALDTARLLAKHRAFSPEAAQSIVRGLAIDLLNGAYDTAQLMRAWQSLEPAERQMPEVAIHAAQRLAALGGDAQLAREWLLPVWERYATLGDSLKTRLAQALEESFESLDGVWLARIEAAQRANPRDGTLQYLAGMACMHRQLWGKAQQLLTQAALGLQDARMHRKAWRALAQLAEQRGEDAKAGEAWKRAASD
ncbi:MAG TPA: heme biosynthesis HemY N-terminal domain-containing protein [Ramlibacter sp.]|uniref:heme biosynthesis HemY N-terminal domain-containing protein n=1 Tax=Ramlibacter sp. TaxID=1917967 RepID=UPI002B941E2F|nr:heme biosynthesis HemY N-terminal domain-containing protein [Ramlibacter sp.]HVZ45311.1 heme biosynthesis HemY N-terminal domain-containing protein [Ramlibacter sp.]